MKKPNFKTAVKIAEKLHKAGFIVFLAGGCVRDMLLKKLGHNIEPKDFDITTNAEPLEVSKIFKKTIDVGIPFGVTQVVMDGANYEVATFRNDLEYINGRHPVGIEFSSAEDDAKRRDFTVNGIFYDPIKKKIIDFVGGEKDLKKRIIRAIGDPYLRFNEDKLRMMRAIRFACQLNFNIENKTYDAIKKLSNQITRVSYERIRDELTKILLSKNHFEGITMLVDTGLLKQILPELEELRGVPQPEEFHPEGDVFQHTILMLKHFCNEKHPYEGRLGIDVNDLQNRKFEILMGALLHDVGKKRTMKFEERWRFDGHSEVGKRMALNICKRLKLTTEQTKIICDLVAKHLHFIDVKKMRQSTLKRFLRTDNFNLHLELHRLDCLASHRDLSNYEFCLEKLEEFHKQAQEECLKPKPLINGNDLIKLGFKPGPIFKKILTFLEDAQLENKIKTKDEAVKLIMENFKL